MARAETVRPLGLPLGVSAVLHVAAAAALFLLRPDAPTARPPIYSVNLVAAPAGERQMGIVAPPATQPTREAPPPRRPERNEPAMPAPTPPRPQQRRPTAPATPTPTPATKAPPVEQQQRAGGGAEGGRGTDVANVRTEGIDFPYRGYLENIVRQIALRFTPNTNSPLRAEVMFLIHRDGRVSGIRILQSSRNYSFDLDAQGAIEAAANAGAFGPLPTGFTDDVLPVVFSFDPRIVR